MKTNEKDTKQGIVPALRFPEFHGSKGWDLKPLSDYLTEYRQKSDGKSKVHSVSLSKGIVNQIEYLGRSFSADDTSHYKLVKPYDVVYTKSPTGDFPYGIVKQNFNPYNVIVSPLYGVFTPNNQYIGYIIHSIFESAIRLNNYLSTLIQKGAKNTIQISNDTFISKEILLPDNETEQQKIADYLSSIDALIKAAENKIDELKAHKKGLMQQLFPAEGKTVPALRFPEFQNAGEWTKISLGELTYKVSKKNKAGKLYPIYSINNKQGFIRQEEQFTGVDSNDRGYDLSLYSIVGSKTFAYNPARINVGSIGYSGDLKDVIISSLYVCFKTSETVNDEFLLKYFETESFKKAVLNSVEGGIRSYLFYDNFAKINLYLPPNYDTAEQQKIADCLSSADNLIIAQTNRLEALKVHKKGLMQQLFPNIE